jgi:hypothetical protein
LRLATKEEARDLSSWIADLADELEGVVRRAKSMLLSYDYIRYDLKPCGIEKIN